MLDLGYCRKIHENYYYSSEFVNELQNDFILQKEALEDLCVSRQTLVNNSKFFKRIVIGKISLISKSAVNKYKIHGINTLI